MMLLLTQNMGQQKLLPHTCPPVAPPLVQNEEHEKSPHV